MRRITLLTTAAAALLSLSSAAGATAVSGSFSGYIYNEFSNSGLTNQTYGVSNLSGTNITGTFTFNSSSMSVSGDGSTYALGTPSFTASYPLSINFNINNVTTIISANTNSIMSSGVGLYQNYNCGGCTMTSYSVTTANTNGMEAVVGISATNANQKIISNFNDIGSASLSWQYGSFLGGTSLGAGGSLYLADGSRADFNLTSFAVAPSPVPLPAAFPMFASGIVGLAALGRRRFRQDKKQA